jgi:hypothetical protein
MSDTSLFLTEDILLCFIIQYMLKVIQSTQPFLIMNTNFFITMNSCVDSVTSNILTQVHVYPKHALELCPVCVWT